MRTPRELLDQAVTIAREGFMRVGSVVPTFALVDAADEVTLLFTPYRSDDERHAAFLIARLKAAEVGAKMCAMASEGWALSGEDPDALLAGPRPHEHPERREVVVVVVDDGTGTDRAAVMDLVSREPPQLGPVEICEYPRDPRSDGWIITPRTTH